MTPGYVTVSWGGFLCSFRISYCHCLELFWYFHIYKTRQITSCHREKSHVIPRHVVLCPNKTCNFESSHTTQLPSITSNISPNVCQGILCWVMSHLNKTCCLMSCHFMSYVMSGQIKKDKARCALPWVVCGVLMKWDKQRPFKMSPLMSWHGVS